MLEAAELGPGRPVGHQVAVGDEHARRPLVRAHDADRLARLHEHRLVGLERAQRAARARRTPPSCARRGRCRRRRPGRRGSRRPRGRGCSCSMRSAASCCQPSADSSRPRGLRTGRDPAVMTACSFSVGCRSSRGRRRRARRRRAACRSTTSSWTASISGASQRSGPAGSTTARMAACAAPVPAAGVSGARKSSARAAVISSMASTRDEPVDAAAQLAPGAPAHRHVVLLHRRGRDRVHARRRREPLELAHDPRRRVLRDH